MTDEASTVEEILHGSSFYMSRNRLPDGQRDRQTDGQMDTQRNRQMGTDGQTMKFPWYNVVTIILYGFYMVSFISISSQCSDRNVRYIKKPDVRDVWNMSVMTCVVDAAGFGSEMSEYRRPFDSESLPVSQPCASVYRQWNSSPWYVLSRHHQFCDSVDILFVANV